MGRPLKALYQDRVADECPACNKGGGEIQHEKNRTEVYVACTECPERTEPARSAVRAEAYELVIRRWNLAVAQQRDGRRWEMTGPKLHEKRQKPPPPDGGEAGQHPTM